MSFCKMFKNNIQRSNNNPHGLLITDYKTIMNKDLEYIPKNSL